MHTHRYRDSCFPFLQQFICVSPWRRSSCWTAHWPSEAVRLLDPRCSQGDCFLVSVWEKKKKKELPVMHMLCIRFYCFLFTEAERRELSVYISVQRERRSDGKINKLEKLPCSLKRITWRSACCNKRHFSSVRISLFFFTMVKRLLPLTIEHWPSWKVSVIWDL